MTPCPCRAPVPTLVLLSFTHRSRIFNLTFLSSYSASSRTNLSQRVKTTFSDLPSQYLLPRCRDHLSFNPICRNIESYLHIFQVTSKKCAARKDARPMTTKANPSGCILQAHSPTLPKGRKLPFLLSFCLLCLLNVCGS